MREPKDLEWQRRGTSNSNGTGEEENRSSAGSPQGNIKGLQTTNNHPHPLVLTGGFDLSSKIFLKTKVRGIPNFDEKQGTTSWISRVEKDF